MEDVWRCSQHSLLLAPSPPTHSPTLIELFVSPPVIVAGAPNSLIQNSACIPSSLLHLQYSAYLTKCSWRAAQRRKGRFSGAISHNPSCDWVFHKGVLNNENYIWLRFTKAFPDITSKLHLTGMQGLQEGLQMLKYEFDSDFVGMCRFDIYFGCSFDRPSSFALSSFLPIMVE